MRVLSWQAEVGFLGRLETCPTYKPPVSRPAARRIARLTATLASWTLYSLFERGVARATAAAPAGFGQGFVDGPADEHVGRLGRNPRRRGDVPQHDLGLAHDSRLDPQGGGSGGQRIVGAFAVADFVRGVRDAIGCRQQDVRQQLAGQQRVFPLAFVPGRAEQVGRRRRSSRPSSPGPMTRADAPRAISAGASREAETNLAAPWLPKIAWKRLSPCSAASLPPPAKRPRPSRKNQHCGRWSISPPSVP